MISIIGAGPVGSYCAYLLAEKGFNVNIYEEHSAIGVPVQCTGLVTSSIKNLVKEESFIVNKISKVKLYSQREEIELKLRNKEFVVDRKKFDNYFANKAVDAGATLFLNHEFLSYENQRIKIKNKKTNSVLERPTNVLIGADGPLSDVAKSAKMFGKRDFYFGIQAIARMECNKDIYSVYFDVPEFFGWVVPENNKIARIGLAAKKNVNYYFLNFLKRFKLKIIKKQAGLIPVYNPKIKTQKNNIYLVGDAATQVKATTGGGLFYGLTCAKILAHSISNKKDYEKEWRKVGKELMLHLRIRSILNKFSNKDYDFLLSLLKKDKIKKIIEHGKREFPSRLLFRLMVKEPKLLYFLRKLL